MPALSVCVLFVQAFVQARSCCWSHAPSSVAKAAVVSWGGCGGPPLPGGQERPDATARAFGMWGVPVPRAPKVSSRRSLRELKRNAKGLFHQLSCIAAASQRVVRSLAADMLRRPCVPCPCLPAGLLVQLGCACHPAVLPPCCRRNTGALDVLSGAEGADAAGSRTSPAHRAKTAAAALQEVWTPGTVAHPLPRAPLTRCGAHAGAASLAEGRPPLGQGKWRLLGSLVR